MKDRDDWSLGDEPEARCAQCGKRNRAGLRRCVICGTLLVTGLEADGESLRTIGEVMGGGRSGRGRSRTHGRVRRWAWPLAALALALLVAVLYWMGTREERHLVLPTEILPPAPVATTTAEQRGPAPVVLLTASPEPLATARPLPEESPLARELVAPSMTASPSAPRPANVPPSVSIRERTQHRPIPTPTRKIFVSRPAPTPAPATEGTVRDTTPRVPSAPVAPSSEKPSVGTDLREATLAYRAAIETHNARVDEYNAIVDEIQRRQAWDDSRESRALRARLERARVEVERTRRDAEAMRVQMEEVRARYR